MDEMEQGEFGQPSSKKSKHVCDICTQSFDRAERWANHVLKKLCGGISCRDCQKPFNSLRDLERHKKTAKKFACFHHCDRRFCTEYEYQRHKRQIKPVHQPSEDSINEVIFPSIFDGIPEYEELKRKHYGIIKGELRAQKSPCFYWLDWKSLIIRSQQKKTHQKILLFGWVMAIWSWVFEEGF